MLLISSTQSHNSRYILLAYFCFFFSNDSSPIQYRSPLRIRGGQKSEESSLSFISLSCERNDVGHAQEVYPWGRADSESLIREGVSVIMYLRASPSLFSYFPSLPAEFDIFLSFFMRHLWRRTTRSCIVNPQLNVHICMQWRRRTRNCWWRDYSKLLSVLHCFAWEFCRDEISYFSWIELMLMYNILTLYVAVAVRKVPSPETKK